MTLGERNEPYFDAVVKSFEQNTDNKYELFNPKEMTKKFPMLNMGPKVWGCFDPAAGILMADKALKLLWSNYQKHGGKILDNCTVEQVIPQKNKVQLVLGNGSKIEAKSVVVCAGPWTSRIMEPLG